MPTRGLRRRTSAGLAPLAVLAHPSADCYGSDRMLLTSARGLVEAGWRVLVVLPRHGPLEDLLQEAGVAVTVVRFPALRRTQLNPLGLLVVACSLLASLPRLHLLILARRPAVVHVNTVTLPMWHIAARLARVPLVCHVHEAEPGIPTPVARIMLSSLRLCRRVLVNSIAAQDQVIRAQPQLASRTSLLYNGLDGPPVAARPPAAPTGRLTLVLPGRLSHRKGTDTAIEATALLLRRGVDVELRLLGDVVAGQEWYARSLVDLAEALGLPPERLSFLGFHREVWPQLAASHLVLVPSRIEPFGNVAVEAQLACRPLVASSIQGLREIVEPGLGTLVPPNDAAGIADAVQALLADWPAAVAMAERGRSRALDRFTVERYVQGLVSAVTGVSDEPRDGRVSEPVGA